MAIEGGSTAYDPVVKKDVSIADGGEEFSGRLEFNEADRARLAQFLGLQSVDSFCLEYRLSASSQDRFLLTGHLDARVTQLCVVTLEPVSGRIEEEISLECWPEAQLGVISKDEAGTEDGSLPEDLPVPIVGGRVDLGALAAELLASAIDPYPRKEGVDFDWRDPKDGSSDNPASPFAELAKLKSKL